MWKLLSHIPQPLAHQNCCLRQLYHQGEALTDYLPSILWRARSAWGCWMPGLPSLGLPERGERRNIYSLLLGRSQSLSWCCAHVYDLNYQYTIINLSCRPQTRQRKARMFRALVLCPRRGLWGHPRHHPELIGLKLCTQQGRDLISLVAFFPWAKFS